MTRLFGRNYTRKQLTELTGDMSQLAGVRRAELVEGNERGADLVEVFNASGLCFSVLPGRALDVASAHFKGISLCFRSSTGDVGPGFYEPQGIGPMRGFFGGLVYTCGLTFVGHPETDPEEENEELPLHGRVSYIPAKNVTAEGAWEDKEYTVKVRGKMRETVVFGTNLEMTREISTTLGEKCLRIHDRVENLSVDPSPLMVVYHTNPGFPVVDRGSRLFIHSHKSTDLQTDVEVNPEKFQTVAGPSKTSSFVVVHRPHVDRRGDAHVALINDRLELGIYWKFSRREIPVVSTWHHFVTGTYVMGIEAGNCSVAGRISNRKHGTLEHIGPGEVRDFHMEIGVLEGPRETRAFERAVNRGAKATRRKT